ncbi:glycosyltransferase [Rubellicoccus peritrichatus]|uniref:Glycosyltransferase n=1 Tax=Rubellicoccus peritrichatus TaxID=3080537 RepID=A0AAQ3LBF0_9BACT|nr:glycosyltransferase [Puniceicoccus sp. CR14]WOO41439.1 glycosyltransferase [Puniceicoccus sp. CR14]
MKILAVTSELPYPPTHGGARLRQFEILKRIADEHEIHLVTFWESTEDRDLTPDLAKHFASVKALMKPPPRPSRTIADRFRVPHWRLTWTDEMLELIKEQVVAVKPDIAYVTPEHMAFYIDAFSGIPSWIDITDSGELFASSSLALSRSIKDYLRGVVYLNAVKSFERTWFPKYNGCSLVAQADADSIKKLCPDLAVHVVPNGVDTDFFSPTNVPSKSKRLVFTGTMDFAPNIDAVTWFCHEIFPLIRKKIPAIEFDIIGRVPSEEVTQLEKLDGVKVHGFVPDLREAVQRASVYVCPMRKGAGMKNKILEAMAMGVPIVSTASGATGIEFQDNVHGLIRDTAISFAEAVCDLVSTPQKGESLAKVARKAVCEHYSWDHSAELMSNCLSQLQKDSEKIAL